MRLKRILIPAVILMTAAILFSACGTPAAPQTSAAPAETTAAATTAAEPETTEPESTEAPEEELRGVIVDGAMHTILVQTAEGELLEISRQMEEGTDPDLTGLKEGIQIGRGVLVTGQRGGDGAFTALKLEDADIACTDPDAMEAAVDVFFSFRARNLETLADRISYPLAVGKDTEVTSEDELKERLKEEDIFTDQLVSAVTGADLTKIAPEDGNMAVPGEGEARVVISLTDDGWAVTEIDP